MNRTRKTIKAMTGSAFLIAISVVLTRFLSPYLAIGGANSLRIGLGTIPIMLGSIIYGPIYGGLIGAASDVVGAFMFPVGAYNPGFTISSALQGILPYVVIRLFSGKPKSKMIISSLLLSALVITNVSFLVGHDSYKFTESFTLRFNETGKILFVLGLAILFSSVLISSYFINKKYKDKNRDSKLKMEDIFLLVLVNETIIGVLISSIWKMLYFNLDYVAMTFSASILLLFNVPVKSVVLFLLAYPLSKVYPDWAISSKTKSTKVLLQEKTRLIADPIE